MLLRALLLEPFILKAPAGSGEAPLLDARAVLARGYGRYWQFTTVNRARGALDPEAVYVDEMKAVGLETLLEQHLDWFIPHGTTHIPAVHVATFALHLGTFTRMPDEGARAAVWGSLQRYFEQNSERDVYVRRQVFR